MDAPVGELVSAALGVYPARTRINPAANYARGFSLPDMRLTISGTSGFIAKVIDEGTPGDNQQIFETIPN